MRSGVICGCMDRGRRAVRSWSDKWVYGQRRVRPLNLGCLAWLVLTWLGSDQATGGVSQLWSRGRLLGYAINATVAAATAVNKTDSTVILPCLSVMLKQDELAIIKALSTLHRRLAT